MTPNERQYVIVHEGSKNDTELLPIIYLSRAAALKAAQSFNRYDANRDPDHTHTYTVIRVHPDLFISHSPD